jgi:hypothetical protein
MRFGMRRFGVMLAAALMTSQLLADVREVRLAVKGAT